MEALAGAVVERFGRVDILCSNAGIGPMAFVADLTLADWRWMIDVNLWGTIHTLTSFLPLLRANPDGGHIVATASMAGLIAAPGLGSYCLTKFGLVGLMETLAIEMAAEGGKVGVSILCPGPVRSNLGLSTRSRPTGLEGALADVDLENSEQFKGEPIDWLSAEDTAQLVLDAIGGGDRYVITHPAMLPAVVARHRAIEAAFASAADRPRR
jgi:NAD(P)-dependent dehydrogenase (short-subunit alcohol dehydrogenase family)